VNLENFVLSGLQPVALNVGLETSKILGHVNSKKILVTGGASFIGSHLVEALVFLGANVVVVDDLSSGALENLENVKSDINLIEADVRSISQKDPNFSNLDGIFHLAAVHGGRGFIESYPFDCAQNVALDAAAIGLAVKNNAAWFTIASSACAYPTKEQGIGARNLLREELIGWDPAHGIEPDGYYGWAKMYGEVLLSSASKQTGITGTAARIFTAYGERENESHAAVALLLKGMLKLNPYPVWGDGTQTRNFTYVGDTVAGLLATLLHKPGMHALNIGTQSHVSVNEFCDEVFRQLDWRPETIDYQRDMPRGVASRASDNTKILELSGWEPKTSIQYGINQMINYWSERLDGYDVLQLQSKLLAR
jgi:nucleoside-diphosphate-sugar epimerase